MASLLPNSQGNLYQLQWQSHWHQTGQHITCPSSLCYTNGHRTRLPSLTGLATASSPNEKTGSLSLCSWGKFHKLPKCSSSPSPFSCWKSAVPQKCVDRRCTCVLVGQKQMVPCVSRRSCFTRWCFRSVFHLVGWTHYWDVRLVSWACVLFKKIKSERKRSEYISHSKTKGTLLNKPCIWVIVCVCVCTWVYVCAHTCTCVFQNTV